jgi:hypothetical protein
LRHTSTAHCDAVCDLPALSLRHVLAAKGLARGAPVVSGMIGLAELRLEAGDAAGALAAAKQGLKFVFDRSKVSPWVFGFKVPAAGQDAAACCGRDRLCGLPATHA